MTCPRMPTLTCVALLAWSCSSFAALSGPEKRIVAAIDARTEPAIELLAETVNIQSASENTAGVRAVGDVYTREFRALGFDTRWVELPASMNRGGHFVAT